MADVMLQSLRCPTQLAHTYILIQTDMTHHINMGIVIFPGTIMWSNNELTETMNIWVLIHFNGNIGDICKGGGDSSVGCFVILLAMINKQINSNINSINHYCLNTFNLLGVALISHLCLNKTNLIILSINIHTQSTTQG